MRTFISFVASFAGAALLTALGIIFAPELGAWRVVAFVSAGILALCAIVLLIDLIWRGSLQPVTRHISASRLRTTAVAIAIAAALLGFDYWYFANYSINGGIWHIRLGIEPPPPPPPPPPLPPRPLLPPPPWVGQEEIEAAQKEGRILINYSPAELLGLWQQGQNIGLYLNKWIKIKIKFSAPTQDVLNKKEFLVIDTQVPGLYAAFLSAYFDREKTEAKLISLKPGDPLTAICQFNRIDQKEAKYQVLN